MCLLYMYTTRVVWQSKCKLVMCITRVLHVFTGKHAQAKLECNSVCAHQATQMVNVQTHVNTDTHM